MLQKFHKSLQKQYVLAPRSPPPQPPPTPPCLVGGSECVKERKSIIFVKRLSVGVAKLEHSFGGRRVAHPCVTSPQNFLEAMFCVCVCGSMDRLDTRLNFFVRGSEFSTKCYLLK